MGRHKTITLIHPIEGKVSIDTGIASLIQLLWGLQINTITSCQEHKPGVMWVEFASVNGVQSFLDIITSEWVNEKPKNMPFYDRVTSGADLKKIKGKWEYRVFPTNHFRHFRKKHSRSVKTYSNITLIIVILFPVSDYSKIVRLLSKELKKRINEIEHNTFQINVKPHGIGYADRKAGTLPACL